MDSRNGILTTRIWSTVTSATDLHSQALLTMRMKALPVSERKFSALNSCMKTRAMNAVVRGPRPMMSSVSGPTPIASVDRIG